MPIHLGAEPPAPLAGGWVTYNVVFVVLPFYPAEKLFTFSMMVAMCP